MVIVGKLLLAVIIMDTTLSNENVYNLELDIYYRHVQ